MFGLYAMGGESCGAQYNEIEKGIIYYFSFFAKLITSTDVGNFLLTFNGLILLFTFSFPISFPFIAHFFSLFTHLLESGSIEFENLQNAALF